MHNINCISTRFGGRLGNHILLIYKAFKLALMCKVPFSSVKFSKKYYNTLYSNICTNFVDDIQYNQYQFNLKKHNATYNDLLCYSKQIFQQPTSILLYGCDIWLYPKTLVDLCLFNFLIDGNTALKQKCIEQNLCMFDNNANYALVGISIRRGDFKEKRWSNHQLLSTTYINQLITDIRRKYYNRVKIIITSDDINEVKAIINNNNRCCYFLENTTPEESMLILSFCDYVIGNGNYHRCEDLVTGKYESTYGQIAQILNVSRKFAATTKYSHEYFKQLY